MSELPKGWIEAKFTDFLDVQGGTQPPKSNFFEAYKDGLVRLLQIRDFSSDDKAIYIQDSHKWRKCDEKDVLIARYGASLGRILTGKCGAYNVALAKVVFSNDKFDRKFIIYLLKTPFFQDPLSSTSRSAQNGFNKEDLDRIFLPIAPLNEQRRIVAKLDSLFARSRLAREELERIGGLCDRYRQAVLAAACSGRLTADWREDSESTWQSTILGELIIDKPKNGYSAKPVNYETAFRVLTLTATTSGKFNSECFKYFDQAIDTNSPFWLQPGDILVQRGNTIEYVGVSAIYDGSPNQFIFPDLMMRLRVRPEVINQFLNIVLSCEEARSYLRSKATGTAGTMPKINQPTLISLPIDLPPLEEQREIVQRVEKLFNAIDKIEQQSQKALKLCDRLDQSILTKAFSGKLVPQDLTDEPAEVLLDRIRSEKQDPPKAKRKKTIKS